MMIFQLKVPFQTSHFAGGFPVTAKSFFSKALARSFRRRAVAI